MENTLFTRRECVLLMMALDSKLERMKKDEESAQQDEFQKFWANEAIKYRELYEKVLHYRGYQEDEIPE